MQEDQHFSSVMMTMLEVQAAGVSMSTQRAPGLSVGQVIKEEFQEEVRVGGRGWW